MRFNYGNGQGMKNEEWEMKRMGNEENGNEKIGK